MVRLLKACEVLDLTVLELLLAWFPRLSINFPLSQTAKAYYLNKRPI